MRDIAGELLAYDTMPGGTVLGVELPLNVAGYVLRAEVVAHGSDARDDREHLFVVVHVSSLQQYVFIGGI